MVLEHLLRLPVMDVEALLSQQIEVHNLDNVPLTQKELYALSLSTKFIPVPPLLAPDEAHSRFSSVFEDFKYRILLRFHFGRSTGSNDLQTHFRTSKRLVFDQGDYPLYPMFRYLDVLKPLLSKRAQQSEAIVRESSNPKLSNNLLSTIRHLRKRCQSELVIKPTDKNLGLAVMTQEFYRLHVSRLLASYDSIPNEFVKSLKSSLVTRYRKIIDPSGSLSRSKTRSSKDLLAYLLLRINDFGFQKFFGLPKVHKPVLAFRPVQSYFNWLAQPLASYLSAVLQPFLKRHYNYLCSDSSSLVRTLSQRHDLPQQFTLVTADVVNLYPSIPTDRLKSILEELIEQIRLEFLNSGPNQQMPYSASELLALFKFVIDVNYVEFDGAILKQTSGIPTGSNCSVELANLWLSYEERVVLAEFPSLFYTRYIDDIFAILPVDFDFSGFSQSFNSLHPRLKLEFSTPSTQVEFLDLVISVDDQHHLRFQVHQKSLNKYLYIPKFSFHSPHLFKGFIRGELLRYLLRSTKEVDFVHVAKLFYYRLTKRGYPSSFILNCFKKVSFSDRESLLAEPPPRMASFPPPVFILPFNSNWEHLNPQAAFREALDLLATSGEVTQAELTKVSEVVDEVRVAWSSSKSLGRILTSPGL